MRRGRRWTGPVHTYQRRMNIWRAVAWAVVVFVLLAGILIILGNF